MSKRLEILKKSLAKKEQQLNAKFEQHFATVKQANGQPLNDKRNGQATLNKWERQNESIRTMQKSIEATKQAIEIEEGKIKVVEHANTFIPKEILELVETGELIQWRKHPHTFFVNGIDKARIIWDEKRKAVAHKFVSEILIQEQRTKFAKIYNHLNALLN
jgi:predicted DsbA family dithiol-disulfide isomerase